MLVVKTWFNTVQQVFIIRLVYTYKRCQTVKWLAETENSVSDKARWLAETVKSVSINVRSSSVRMCSLAFAWNAWLCNLIGRNDMKR